MSFYNSAYLSKSSIHWPSNWCSMSHALRQVNICVILMTILCVYPAVAHERTEAEVNQQLIASCSAFSENSEHVDGIPCKYYIKGFLAGAWHLDQVTMAQLKEKDREPANWEERAYFYRVGNRGYRGGLTKLSDFSHVCSPENEPETRIIEILSADSSTGDSSVEALNEKIFGALKVICPADKAQEK